MSPHPPIFRCSAHLLNINSSRQRRFAEKLKEKSSLSANWTLTKSVCCCCCCYFILSRLLFLAYSANLGLLCMTHPGMEPLV